MDQLTPREKIGWALFVAGTACLLAGVAIKTGFSVPDILTSLGGSLITGAAAWGFVSKATTTKG